MRIQIFDTIAYYVLSAFLGIRSRDLEILVDLNP